MFEQIELEQINEINASQDVIKYSKVSLNKLKKIKELKKEIKALFKPNPIHAIRFEVSNGKATMKVVFSDSSGYETRGNTIKEIRSYLEKQGYNPRVFEVEY